MMADQPVPPNRTLPAEAIILISQLPVLPSVCRPGLQRSENGAQRCLAETIGAEKEDVAPELRDNGARRLPETANILDADDFT